jgi:pimeloyl-ACP methyl ester carboxylesterase
MWGYGSRGSWRSASSRGVLPTPEADAPPPRDRRLPNSAAVPRRGDEKGETNLAVVPGTLEGIIIEIARRNNYRFAPTLLGVCIPDPFADLPCLGKVVASAAAFLDLAAVYIDRARAQLGTDCAQGDFAELSVTPAGEVCATDHVFYLLAFQHAGATSAGVSNLLPDCLDPSTVRGLMPEDACTVTGDTLTCTNLPLSAGRGQVSFSAAPKLSCAPGTAIDNQASVTFNDGFQLTTAPASVTLRSCERDCTNGIDDDNDGLTDCADPDCRDRACDGGTGVCQGGQCAPNVVVRCETAADCNDGNICTADLCAADGVCTYERAQEGEPCSGGRGTCLNGQCALFPVAPRADLELWAPCRPEPVCAGGLLSCDVHVRNRGPSAVPSVTVTLDLTGDLQLMGDAEPLRVSAGATAHVPAVSNACTSGDRCHAGVCAGIPCDSCQSCDPLIGCVGMPCTPAPTATGTATGTPLPPTTATPTPTATPASKRPLIFLPGILGSTISYGSEELWPTTGNCLVSRLRPPDNGVPPPATATSVVVGGTWSVCDEAIPVPFGYGTFLSFLRSSPDHELRPFPYDWRLDLQRTADELALFIDTALRETGHDRVDIVAHSMGGLLAKAFLSRSHLNEYRVRRLIFINTPHFGAPWALQALFTGAQITPVGPRARVTAYAARNMPAVYQLLPSRLLPGVLAVRESGLRSQTVPVQSYEDFLVRISGLGWRHQRCFDCPQCAHDRCRFEVESLNANLPGWVRPHEAAARGGAGWDAWAPVDPELDAVILYSQDFEPEFLEPYTLRRLVVAERNVAVDAIRDVELGPGDGTVPIESARADGIGYFDRPGRRFEFRGEHTAVLRRPELQACVSGLIQTARDFSACVAGSGTAAGAQGEAGGAVVQVTLTSDGEADLAIRNAAGLQTGRTLEGGIEESIRASRFVDAGQTQVALVGGEATLTILVRAVEAVSAILRVQERAGGVADRELVYEVALQPGGTIEIVYAPSEAPAANIDTDGDGNVDRTVTPEALPVAKAGDAQTVRSGVEVVLDGSGSAGPAGAPLSYRWGQISGPAVLLSDETAIQPRFTAPEVAEDTALAFALSVAADGVESRPNTATVLVRACGPERCNGLDDDCDGLIDQENPEGGAACSTGRQGACDSGIVQCRAGALQCIAVDSSCEAEGCRADAECNDGLFCNGEERCLSGLCVGGTPPCSGSCGVCDEPTRQCQTVAECSCPEHCNEDVAIPPVLAVEPGATHDLGRIPVGQRTSLTYSVRNDGGGILRVSPATACAEIEIVPESMILLGGIESMLTVNVTPVAAGPFSCELIVASNAGEAVLVLQGVGAACPGDCNGDGRVTSDELLTLVNIALRSGAVDLDGDDRISVDEIVAAVNGALKGCE